MSKDLLQLTEEELKTSSQATYFFDCDGEGLKPDGTINPNSSKGSFCCILKGLRESGKNKQKNNEKLVDSDFTGEYFILTAAHNLKKYRITDDEIIYPGYKLINSNNKTDIIQLEVIKELFYKIIDNERERKDEYIDCAILKIKNNNVTSTDFYKNTIKFNNKYYNSNANAKSVTNDGIIVGSQQQKIYKSIKFIEEIENNEYKLSEKGEVGISGASVFEEKLLGIFINSDSSNGYSCPYYVLEGIKENNYIV